jgi:L-fuconolactonase
VLDHLGKPPIAAGELEPWAVGLRALAAEPNVVCKLSGLQTIASPDWTYRDLAPYIDVALETFGPPRLLFGSDWPVSSPAVAYATVCDVARAACSALSPGEQAAVLAANARAIYRAPLAGRRSPVAIRTPGIYHTNDMHEYLTRQPWSPAWST